MFSQSVELFEFLKQHVAGRSKRMANSQELGAAFRFSLAGLDGRVQPRFSPTGWMIWFFQKSGPASRQQNPVHWRSIPLQEMMFVWSISWKHCHPKATELHTEGANSCLIRTDRKHPAESPFPKQWWPCELRIHQTEQQMRQITRSTFGNWDSALRAVFLSYKSCCPGALSAHCTMSIARLGGKSRLATSMNLNSTNVPTGGDTGGLNHRKPGFPETHIYIIYPQMSPKMMRKKTMANRKSFFFDGIWQGAAWNELCSLEPMMRKCQAPIGSLGFQRAVHIRKIV